MNQAAGNGKCHSVEGNERSMYNLLTGRVKLYITMRVYGAIVVGLAYIVASTGSPNFSNLQMAY